MSNFARTMIVEVCSYCGAFAGFSAHGHSAPAVPEWHWERMEYVPADRLTGAVEALRELVRLKDGPRDDAYRAAKDAAWDAARTIVGGQ